MNTEYDDIGADPIPLPMLSDESVAEIHNFIEYALDLFEARYGDQLHRFYEDRAEHNMVRPTPTAVDPPF